MLEKCWFELLKGQSPDRRPMETEGQRMTLTSFSGKRQSYLKREIQSATDRRLRRFPAMKKSP